MIKNISLFKVAMTTAMLFAAQMVHSQTVLRLGHVWPNSEMHSIAVQQFAEDVAKATNGEVRIDVHGGGTLGSDRELLEAIKFKTNDIWVGGAGVLSTASDAGRIFTMPFMIRDVGHYEAVYDGAAGEEITAQIRKQSGYDVIAYWMRGPRWLTTKKIVQSPDDLAGMKIRVPDSPVTVKSWAAFGAAPTPMNFGEVFNALQQGVIDGQENPLSLIVSSRFSEVVKYLVRTEHAYEPVAIVMDAKRLAALPEAHRKAILEAANGRAKTYASDEVKKGELSFVKQLQSAGMTLVEPDKAPFRSRVGNDFVRKNFPSIAGLYEKIAAVGTEKTQ